MFAIRVVISILEHILTYDCHNVSTGVGKGLLQSQNTVVVGYPNSSPPQKKKIKANSHFVDQPCNRIKALKISYTFDKLNRSHTRSFSSKQ